MHKINNTLYSPLVISSILTSPRSSVIKYAGYSWVNLFCRPSPGAMLNSSRLNASHSSCVKPIPPVILPPPTNPDVSFAHNGTSIQLYIVLLVALAYTEVGPLVLSRYNCVKQSGDFDCASNGCIIPAMVVFSRAISSLDISSSDLFIRRASITSFISPSAISFNPFSAAFFCVIPSINPCICAL